MDVSARDIRESSLPVAESTCATSHSANWLCLQAGSDMDGLPVQGGNFYYKNEAYKMKMGAPMPKDDIAVALEPAKLGYQYPQHSISNDEEELELLRWFLNEAGLPSPISRGDRQQLLGLVGNNLGQKRTGPSA